MFDAFSCPAIRKYPEPAPAEEQISMFIPPVRPSLWIVSAAPVAKIPCCPPPGMMTTTFVSLLEC